MKIEQVMRKALRTCQRDDTLDRVAQAMWEGNCSSIPVVDDRGHLIGSVTDRGICMAAHFEGGPLNLLNVESAIARDLPAGRPEQTVPEAIQTMRINRVRELPIVDQFNRLIGIVCETDLASADGNGFSYLRTSGSFNELTGTLCGVCRCPEDLIAPV